MDALGADPATSGGNGDVVVVEGVAAAAPQTFLSFIMSSTLRASKGGFGRTADVALESGSLHHNAKGMPFSWRNDESEIKKCLGRPSDFAREKGHDQERYRNKFSWQRMIFPLPIPPGQQRSRTPVVHQDKGSCQSRPQIAAEGHFFTQLAFGDLK